MFRWKVLNLNYEKWKNESHVLCEFFRFSRVKQLCKSLCESFLFFILQIVAILSVFKPIRSRNYLLECAVISLWDKGFCHRIGYWKTKQQQLIIQDERIPFCYRPSDNEICNWKKNEKYFITVNKMRSQALAFCNSMRYYRGPLKKITRYFYYSNKSSLMIFHINSLSWGRRIFSQNTKITTWFIILTRKNFLKYFLYVRLARYLGWRRKWFFFLNSSENDDFLLVYGLTSVCKKETRWQSGKKLRVLPACHVLRGITQKNDVRCIRHSLICGLLHCFIAKRLERAVREASRDWRTARKSERVRVNKTKRREGWMKNGGGERGLRGPTLNNSMPVKFKSRES